MVVYVYICVFAHIYICIYMCVCLCVNKISWPNVVERDPKACFAIATTLPFMGRHYSLPWIAPSIHDLYLKILRVK